MTVVEVRRRRDEWKSREEPFKIERECSYYRSVFKKDITIRVGDVAQFKNSTLIRLALIEQLYEKNEKFGCTIRWFQHIDELKRRRASSQKVPPGALQNEVYITDLTEKYNKGLDNLDLNVQVMGVARFDGQHSKLDLKARQTRQPKRRKQDPIFVCRRAVKSRPLEFSDVFEWEGVYKRDDLTGIQCLVITSQTSPIESRVKRSVGERYSHIVSLSSESDLMQTPSKAKRSGLRSKHSTPSVTTNGVRSRGVRRSDQSIDSCQDAGYPTTSSRKRKRSISFPHDTPSKQVAKRPKAYRPENKGGGMKPRRTPSKGRRAIASRNNEYEHVHDSDSNSTDYNVSDSDADELNNLYTPKKVKPRTFLPGTPSKISTGKTIRIKTPLSKPNLPAQTIRKENLILSPHQTVRAKLHASSVPTALPCRENEFRSIYNGLFDAITEGDGHCVYISGTPGTGKTATVHQVIKQLQVNAETGELDEFDFVEMNGMRIPDASHAYCLLWEELTGQRVSKIHAEDLLHKLFTEPNPNRTPCVLLVDELDQLVTKSQSTLYNLFNWPAQRHSRLIVVAIANTMDLPERTLSTKIGSRIGVSSRVTFAGYTVQQLEIIIASRLSEVADRELFEDKAIRLLAASIARVSGDARRALDICRLAVEIAEREIEDETNDGHDAVVIENRNKKKGRVDIPTVRKAISMSTSTPLQNFLKSLPLLCKVYLAALLARMRRSGVVENLAAEIMAEGERLCKQSTLEHLRNLVSNLNKVLRIPGWVSAATVLSESGILAIEPKGGERSSMVRLLIGDEEVKSALRGDAEVEGLFSM